MEIDPKDCFAANRPDLFFLREDGTTAQWRYIFHKCETFFVIPVTTETGKRLQESGNFTRIKNRPVPVPQP